LKKDISTETAVSSSDKDSELSATIRDLIENDKQIHNLYLKEVSIRYDSEENPPPEELLGQQPDQLAYAD